ncbi:hypothetical protein SELMODRAFT_405985 [Selaginella moellendorffii]|uniref:Uncharacterized protein n=1 Tax=Selaginella moellendorffii TaxID=88036 RepID=D8R0A5_SELML|nr:hypothetical protein SELMODRAFT_405985 [Selaginella moellendorffii]
MKSPLEIKISRIPLQEVLNISTSFLWHIRHLHTAPRFSNGQDYVASNAQELGDEEELAAAIMVMYGKCGNLEASATVFSSSAFQQSPATWNSRLAALSRRQKLLFSTAVCPKELHGHIIQRNYARYTFVDTALLNTYSKCGRLEEARVRTKLNMHITRAGGPHSALGNTTLFAGLPWSPPTLPWSPPTGSTGFFGEALQYFQLMQLQDEAPNKVTMPAVLPACSKVELELMNSRAGCGYTGAASNLDMIERARGWKCRSERPCQAGKGLRRKQRMPVPVPRYAAGDSRPDKYTFVTILGVCKQSREDLSHGRLLHQLARENSSSLALLVATAFVHMYSESDERLQSCSRQPHIRCGPECMHRQLGARAWPTCFLRGQDLEQKSQQPASTCLKSVESAAVETFLTLVPQEKSLLAWNGLATALTERSSELGRVLECMQLWGIDPDSVTFSLHSESCACYVLSSLSTSRAGFLEEAEEMVAVKLRNRRQELSSSRSSGGSGDDPLVVLWTSFLDACAIHGDSEHGKRAVKRILARQPEDAAT